MTDNNEVDSTEEIAVTNKADEVEQAEVVEAPLWFFFLATVKIVYTRDERLKERTLNNLVKLSKPVVTQKTIKQINLAAARQVATLLELQDDAIKEAIVLNISFLGQMTEAEYLDNEDEQD